MRRKMVQRFLPLFLLLLLFCGGCGTVEASPQEASGAGRAVSVQENAAADEDETRSAATLDSIPSYDGSPVVQLYGGVPNFTEDEITTEAFETYSPLDALGRCGVAYANICPELMPDEERQSIGQIKPAGWHTVKYPEVIEDNYLYNRCHLIAFMLAGENANEQNLITGTRYLNTEGMLPYETLVSDYVEETGNHVLYRVTPIYSGENLIADGVEMEAYSVEDDGAGVCFHVFAYNVQPGIAIDYATGETALEENAEALAESAAENAGNAESADDDEAHDYVLNTNTKKYHLPSCYSVGEMKNTNKKEYHGTRTELEAKGYTPCGRCHP